LSIFVISVLNFAFPSFSFKIGALLTSKARKKVGRMIDSTKKAYEKNLATFLIVVEFLPSRIFKIDKNVKSK
jgi:hypothetical protein